MGVGVGVCVELVDGDEKKEGINGLRGGAGRKRERGRASFTLYPNGNNEKERSVCVCVWVTWRL